MEQNFKAYDCSSSLILSFRVPQEGDIIVDSYSSDYTPYDPFSEKKFLINENEPYYGPAQICLNLVNQIEKHNECINHSWTVNKNKTSLNLRRYQ